MEGKNNNSSVSYRSLTLDHFLLFRIIGVLPYSQSDETNSLKRTLKNHLASGYCHLVNSIYNSMYLGYGIRMIMNHRLDVDYICEVVIVQGVCMRYMLLYLQRWNLLELTEICRELWDSFVIINSDILSQYEEAKTLRAFERKVYYLRNFFLWNSLLAVTFYIGTAQFVRIPSTQVNASDDRILPYKFYVDVQSDPWYLLVSILQGIVCYSVAVILTGIETVGPLFIMMACGYLRILHDRLMYMAKNNQKHDRLILDDVLLCVKFHQRILQFCEKIDKFTRSIFMVQVLCTIYNMSLIGIKILENDENALRYVSILLLNLLQFFTCQWIPEHLLNESEAIANAAYEASLVHRVYDVRANRMLLLTMLRAEKPIQLTAGGFVKLSLESFERMIVNAFSFFTMLRSLAN